MTRVTIADQRVQVDELYQARQVGRTGLDLSTAGLDREDGLRLQLAVLDRFVGTGDSVAGWKASYTSGKARDKMGAGYRPFGFILGSRTFESGGTTPLDQFANAQIEGELGLLIGEPIGGPISPKDARHVVAEVVACFELNEIRYSRQSDDATILADGCGQWGLVHGQRTTEKRPDLARTSASLWCDGAQVATSPPDLVMDDPFETLSRLSMILTKFGRTIEPGAIVITGSMVKASVTAPSEWRASFDGVGDVTFAFT